MLSASIFHLSLSLHPLSVCLAPNNVVTPYGSGYIGLLPRFTNRGGIRKVKTEVNDLIEEVLDAPEASARESRFLHLVSQHTPHL